MISEKEFLESYNIEDYERPSVTTDIAAFKIGSEDKVSYRKNPENKLQLLLIKRGDYPFKGMWALPGGFLRKGETVEECALREIKEETQVAPSAIIPVGVFSEAKRDPRGWIISNAYVSIICDESMKQMGGTDAAEAQWFTVTFEKNDNGEFNLRLVYDDVEINAVVAEEKAESGYKKMRIIDNGELAFDHAAIISKAIIILRSEAKNYNVIFDFLPEKFTLTLLQKVQETILNVPLLPANFRRMVSGYVEETDEYTSGAGHRPSKLYKRKMN